MTQALNKSTVKGLLHFQTVAQSGLTGPRVLDSLGPAWDQALGHTSCPEDASFVAEPDGFVWRLSLRDRGANSPSSQD
jgi:hypothetical protein